MRNLTLLALCLALLVLQSSLAVLFSLAPFEPQLLLPVAIFLGVSPEVKITRGAALSFVVGYFTDVFCGSPIGLQTFVMVATFLLTRVARFRLMLRGPLFQVALSFALVALAGAVILSIRTVFEKSVLLPLPPIWTALRLILGSAAASALIAPGVIALVRRCDAPSLRAPVGRV